MPSQQYTEAVVQANNIIETLEHLARSDVNIDDLVLVLHNQIYGEGDEDGNDEAADALCDLIDILILAMGVE